jgi:serine/threonine-protein kinase
VRATTADEERLGQVIDGRYRLISIVGRGGMGLVYKAEHVGIRRNVALKLLHTTLASVPELRSRFEREARAIGVISHPNCVDVTDFGELSDGSLYLVMEYLEGRSLGDVLDQDRVLDPVRALRILRHVLAGLGHAHQAGIVHRDVKPENVLLIENDGDKDFAKILDFGIAKLLAQTVDDGVKLTQAGVAFGTPVYMSPEQALGNPVDARADLYAASVMAFEMICGRPPFYSDDKLEVLSMHTARPVPSMSETRGATLGKKSTVPLGVERVVLKGLAKQPRERWQNADDYVSAIDTVLVSLALDQEDAPTGARPLVTPTGRSLIPDPAPRAPEITPTVPSPAAPEHVDVEEAAVEDVEELHDATAERELTPTRLHRSEPLQVLPAVKPRRPAPLYAAAGAAVVILFAVIFLLATGHQPRRPPPSEAALAAAASLERGDHEAAIRDLEARGAAIADDPAAQLQLGHAYAAVRQHAPALLAYRRALELEPALEADPTLRANLIATTDEKDLAAAVAAHELLLLRTRDPDALDRLIAATVGDDPGRRHAAITLVERHGLGDLVDYLTSYQLDLDQLEGCPARKEAVAKLRALGDARAIPALQAAIARKGKTGKWKGKAINQCLADDARAAIAFLEGLASGE